MMRAPGSHGLLPNIPSSDRDVARSLRISHRLGFAASSAIGSATDHIDLAWD